ncbi:glycosyltransferase [Paenibacillus massiliensis]|uniref:glycosyltransferase n=1 Tax=Paenibacillus massiliensis TaxID=225917 RepID=UPI0004099866|nr:glycosyltransferase [Paenibacillus massiliensis]
MKHQTISLCMIVKNEERTLARCLESVQGIVDELIVVDTGSVDKTVEIAEGFGAKIYHYDWDNNFSNARNYALQFASCDYVLSLDADEWLEDASKSKLLDLLNRSYYFLRIRNVIRAGVVDTHSFVRLFKRSVGYKYEGYIHEQINHLDFPDDKGGNLQVYINHDGYTQVVMQGKSKKSRNMMIIEKELEEAPTAFGYFNLGTQYKVAREPEKAIEAFKKAYALGPDKNFIPKLIIYLIQCLTEQQRYGDAINVLNDSIPLHPKYTDYHYYLGTIYAKLHYWKDAEQCFLKCIELGEVEDFLYSSLEGVGSYMAHAHLANVYLALEEREKALNHVSQSIRQNSVHVASLKIWLDMFSNSDWDDLLKGLHSLYSLHSVEEAGVVMQALYQLRNPLFLKLSGESSSSQADAGVSAWLKQLNGEYESAKLNWTSNPDVTSFHLRDIFFLAVVTQDADFYRGFSHIANLRQKEQNLMLKIVKREEIVGLDKRSLSRELIQHFSNLCYDLLMLREYETIEYLMTQVQSVVLRLELSKQLYKFKFTELGLQALLEPGENSEKVAIFIMAGDLLRDAQQFGDSYQYYLEANHIQPSYELALKMYLLADKVGDQDIKGKSLKLMSEFTPVSPWAYESFNNRPEYYLNNN